MVNSVHDTGTFFHYPMCFSGHILGPLFEVDWSKEVKVFFIYLQSTGEKLCFKANSTEKNLVHRKPVIDNLKTKNRLHPQAQIALKQFKN